MSRGKLHCIVAVVALVGFLTVAAPRAEAAGGTPAGPDFWSLALRWVEDWWEGAILNIREQEGGMIDPNGGQSAPPSSPPEESASEEWWPLSPDS
jgi:hypothetical protein